ncbi:MAG TPA: hypothetical protein EYO76_13530 [Flavobacteriaceae bacterium]|nr:hypothetical protein [Flavobacteriaceae bacterium]
MSKIDLTILFENHYEFTENKICYSAIKHHQLRTLNYLFDNQYKNFTETKINEHNLKELLASMFRDKYGIEWMVDFDSNYKGEQ